MRISITFLILSFALSSNAQKNENRLSLIFTLHNSNYSADGYQFKSKIGFGVGAKFRLSKEVKKINPIIGIGFEQWPIKKYLEFSDIYYDMDWSALSIPVGLQIGVLKKINLHPYFSFDLPFLSNVRFPNEPGRTSLEVGLYNLSIGAGLDLTYQIPLSNSDAIIVGLRYKYNTILALRKHDYYLLNDDEYPYHYGLIIGYHF